MDNAPERRPQITRGTALFLLIMAIVIGGLFAYNLWAQREDEIAIQTLDYSRCHTSHCTGQVAARRLGAPY